MSREERAGNPRANAKDSSSPLLLPTRKIFAPIRSSQHHRVAIRLGVSGGLSGKAFSYSDRRRNKGSKIRSGGRPATAREICFTAPLS